MTANSTSDSATPVNPSEVGWQFLPKYYSFVHQQPNRLHCFYKKQSTFIHGTEGDDEEKPCFGQQVSLLLLKSLFCGKYFLKYFTTSPSFINSLLQRSQFMFLSYGASVLRVQS